MVSMLALGAVMLALRAAGSPTRLGFPAPVARGSGCAGRAVHRDRAQPRGRVRVREHGAVARPVRRGQASGRQRLPLWRACRGGRIALQRAVHGRFAWLGDRLAGRAGAAVVRGAGGSALALPYLLAAFVPAIAMLLPKPGGWMQTLRRPARLSDVRDRCPGWSGCWASRAASTAPAHCSPCSCAWPRWCGPFTLRGPHARHRRHAPGRGQRLVDWCHRPQRAPGGGAGDGGFGCLCGENPLVGRSGSSERVSELNGDGRPVFIDFHGRMVRDLPVQQAHAGRHGLAGGARCPKGRAAARRLDATGPRPSPPHSPPWGATGCRCMCCRRPATARGIDGNPRQGRSARGVGVAVVARSASQAGPTHPAALRVVTFT